MTDRDKTARIAWGNDQVDALVAEIYRIKPFKWGFGYLHATAAAGWAKVIANLEDPEQYSCHYNSRNVPEFGKKAQEKFTAIVAATRQQMKVTTAIDCFF